MENIERLNHYDGAEVIERFNIEKVPQCETLDKWVNVSGTLTTVHQEILREAQEEIIKFGRDWNEEELKMNFVA